MMPTTLNMNDPEAQNEKRQNTQEESRDQETSVSLSFVNKLRRGSCLELTTLGSWASLTVFAVLLSILLIISLIGYLIYVYGFNHGNWTWHWRG
jgi:hypothetical protein